MLQSLTEAIIILSYTDLLNLHDVSFAQKEKNEIMNEILLSSFKGLHFKIRLDGPL